MLFPSHGAVVVTGAAQGIGRHIVSALVHQDVSVVLADVNEEKGLAVANAPEEGNGRKVFVKCDVSLREDCLRLAQAAADLGGLFGLVNNASVFSTLEMRPFWEIPEEEWDRVISVNLKGVWQVSRAIVPHLRGVAGASIVNMSSATVHIGRANYAHYVASKAGVIGLTRAMSRELGGAGIRVNAITPGPIFTEMPRASVTPEQKIELIAAQAQKRPGSPEDIGRSVSYLLSSQSDYVTGQVLNVDGGMVNY